MFKNSALFGTSFPLVKIAPKVRGYVIDCSEFCVLFRGTRSIAGYDIILRVGNKDFGFKHFLLKHYGTGCVGEIKANDILKLGNVIKNNISVPAKEDKIKFIQTKGDLKYSVVLKPQKDGKLVVSFFSSKEEIKIIEQIEIINEIIISVEIETKL